MKFTFGLCLYSPLHLPFDFSSVHFCTFAPCGMEVPSAACRIPPPVRIPLLSCFQTCHINLRRPEPLGGQGHRRHLAVSHPAELLPQSNITLRCTLSSLLRTRERDIKTRSERVNNIAATKVLSLQFALKVNSPLKSPQRSNYAKSLTV